jgi:hypothetical protein
MSNRIAPGLAREIETASGASRTLVSNCRGAITHILFVLSRGQLTTEGWLADTLLRIPPRWCRISVVVPQRATEWVSRLVRQAGVADRTEIIAAPDGADLTSWVQDTFAVREDGRGRCVLVATAHRPSNLDIARCAARAKDVSGLCETAIGVDGGNMLAGEDALLIGADLKQRWLETVRRKNLAWPGESAEEACRRICVQDLESRRRIVVVRARSPVRKRRPRRFEHPCLDRGWREDVDQSVSHDGSLQPIFHIDMFVTLAGRSEGGRERVLVGDPNLAAKMTGMDLPRDFTADAFDEIAEALRSEGFDVLRNPLPLVFADRFEHRMREWFFASYNNCLVQQSVSRGSLVWLPEFGCEEQPWLRTTDAANRRIWRDIGYEVRPAGHFLPLARRLGSLNCVAKVLCRASD